LEVPEGAGHVRWLEFSDGVVVEAVEDLGLHLEGALGEVLGGGGDLLGDLGLELVAQFFHALGLGAFPVVEGLLRDAGEFACARVSEPVMTSAERPSSIFSRL
jgi:hypothetical protein